MSEGWEMASAALMGVGAGVLLAWVCWQIFGEGEPEDGDGQRRTRGEAPCKGAAVRVVLEPEMTQEEVRSFYAKLDGPERNVPVALVEGWKQMAAERMAAVQSAEEFAFEQGRLAAFGEMEKAFLELATELKTPGDAGETGEEEGEDA